MQVAGTEGRVAVVTGGARGIGDAVIRALAQDGVRSVSIDLGTPDDPVPGTRYEAKGLAGHPPAFLRFRRRAERP